MLHGDTHLLNSWPNFHRTFGQWVQAGIGKQQDAVEIWFLYNFFHLSDPGIFGIAGTGLINDKQESRVSDAFLIARAPHQWLTTMSTRVDEQIQTFRMIFPSGNDEDLLLQMTNLHSSPPPSLISFTPTSLTNRRCLKTYFDLPCRQQQGGR